MGICSEITDGNDIVALTEGFMVVDVLERSAKELVVRWRSCVGLEVTVYNPSCVVEN